MASYRDDGVRNAVAKAESADGFEVEEAKERSQIPSRARPCAVLARRPTVQIMEASRASSSSVRREGSRWAARRKGSVVVA